MKCQNSDPISDVMSQGTRVQPQKPHPFPCTQTEPNLSLFASFEEGKVINNWRDAHTAIPPDNHPSSARGSLDLARFSDLAKSLDLTSLQDTPCKTTPHARLRTCCVPKTPLPRAPWRPRRCGRLQPNQPPSACPRSARPPQTCRSFRR